MQGIYVCYKQFVVHFQMNNYKTTTPSFHPKWLHSGIPVIRHLKYMERDGRLQSPFTNYPSGN